MNELEQTFYAGVPIILDVEKALIEDNRIFTEGRRISSVEVGNAFVIVNPKIQRIIEHDQDTWQNFEYMNQDAVTEDYFPKYLEGIAYGYSSVIRIFSTVYYLRSGFNSLEEYLNRKEFFHQFPRITEEDVKIINNFRFGSLNPDFNVEVIDFNLREGEEEVDSTSLLPLISFDEYTDICENFNSLIDSELDCLALDQDDEEEQNAFAEGFWHGVSNAIEMFFLLAQSRLFREHFDQDFKDNFDRLFDNLTK